jgi:hypothetical protein
MNEKCKPKEKPPFWNNLFGRTEKCGEVWYNPYKKCCVGIVILSKCEERCYLPELECCLKGKIGKKCDKDCYDSKKECCVNGKIVKKCGEECYNPETQCCPEKKIWGILKKGEVIDKCGGECYNPEEECCKEGKKYTNKIKNLDDCPARYQKKRPKANGCGPENRGWMFTDNPTGGKYTSFKDACDEHDIDYDTCKKDATLTDGAYKAIADAKFLKSMQAVCKDERNFGVYMKCMVESGRYHAMVDPGIINDSYRNAQLERCQCCPSGALILK